MPTLALARVKNEKDDDEMREEENLHRGLIWYWL